jgi:hypothetical protein
MNDASRSSGMATPSLTTFSPSAPEGVEECFLGHGRSLHRPKRFACPSNRIRQIGRDEVARPSSRVASSAAAPCTKTPTHAASLASSPCAKQRADGPGKDVAAARGAERGIGRRVDVGGAIGKSDDGARPLEHHDGARLRGQPAGEPKTVFRHSAVVKPQSRAISPGWGVRMRGATALARRLRPRCQGD